MQSPVSSEWFCVNFCIKNNDTSKFDFMVVSKEKLIEENKTRDRKEKQNTKSLVYLLDNNYSKLIPFSL